MSKYLIPAVGQTTYGIAICDRCRMKRFLDDLEQDPTYPGLRVCSREKIRDGCKDDFDPWRLPMRPTEKITLPFNRPDVLLGLTPPRTLDERPAPFDYTVDQFGALQPPTSGDRATLNNRSIQAIVPGPPAGGVSPVRLFLVDSFGTVIIYTPAPGTAQ